MIKQSCPKSPQRQQEGHPKPASPSPLSMEGAVVVPFVDLLRSISAQVPMFVKDCVSSSTLEAKRDTLWTILRYAHEVSPIPGVTEILNAIDAKLAQAPSAIVELQEMDVVEGERSRMFYAQVSGFLEEFQGADNRVARVGVARKIVLTLREEGF